MQIGLGKKYPKNNDQCVPWLMKLSKAALADCVVDLLRPLQDSVDEEVTQHAAITRLRVVLNHRGDKVPKEFRVR